MKKLVLSLIVGILLISLISAATFDNVIVSPEITKGINLSIGEKQIAYTDIWDTYKPIEIKNLFGLGPTLFKGAITQHDFYCYEDCKSTLQVYLADEGVLIDSIKFLKGEEEVSIPYKIFVANKYQDAPVNDYEYVCTIIGEHPNKTQIEKCEYKVSGSHLEKEPIWQGYNIEDKVLAGDYEIKIEGTKKPSESIDWIITSQGREIGDWATWADLGLTTGLTTYYRLDETSGSTLSDVVGGHTATLTGGTANSTTGKIDTAIYFNESAKYNANISYYDFGNNTNTWSASGWYNGVPYQWRVLWGTQTAEYFGADMYITQDNQLGCRVGNGTGWKDTSTPFIFTNYSWYHVACTLNSTNINVYINGILNYSEATTGRKIYIPAGDLALGGEGTTGLGFKGVIDELGIWNRTLSADEVKALYSNGNGLPYPLGNTTSPFTNNAEQYNATAYETAEESFRVNITYNSSLYTISGKLNYNGTEYAGTKIGTGNTINFTTTISIPSGWIGGHNFYWNLTFVNGTGTYYFQTDTLAQTVDWVNLTNCSGGQNPYINFTFKDENTNSDMNASITTSTWNYWIGNGSSFKTLTYSNATELSSHSFCLVDGNRTMHNNRSMVYQSTGYPSKTYSATSDLTNTTTNLTLYLLSSSDGIYVIIQIVNNTGGVVIGASVTAEREISGVWTNVGSEVSDDAGSVTFWINPLYDHRFTFIKNGCSVAITTIRPSQPQYTQILDCGATGNQYGSSLEGIKSSRTPSSGLLNRGLTNFTFSTNSTKLNLEGMLMYLYLVNGTLVNQSNSSSIDPSGGIIWLTYNVTSGIRLRGTYYVDIGAGWMLIESDAQWIEADQNITGISNWRKFIQDFKTLFDDWHEEGVDVTNTKDFSRITFIFLFLAILLAFLSKTTNYEMSHPGAFLIIFTIIIVMLSIAGFMNYDYPTGNPFFMKYGIALATVITTFAWMWLKGGDER